MQRVLRLVTGVLPAHARRVLSRLATTDLEVLVNALLIVLGAWTFIVVAQAVMEGDTRAIDEAIMRALRDEENPADAIGPPWVEDAVRDLTALGSNAVLTLGSLAVVVFLVIRRQYHAAVLVVVAALGGVLLMNLLKAFFARPRPALVPHLTRVASPSFPSGHALTAAVIYLTLATLLARLVEQRRVKAYVIGVALAITLVVGFTRVYLGVHYPSDVLAGWAIGLTWAVLCWSVASYLQRRGTVEKPHETTQ